MLCSCKSLQPSLTHLFYMIWSSTIIIIIMISPYIYFLHVNVIRLNKQKLEKLRQDYGENSETYKGFHHMFWAFSKTPLTQTLTKIATPEVEQQALQISLAILTYAGLNPNGK